MMGAQETTVGLTKMGGGGGGGLKNATRRKGFPKVFEPIRGRGRNIMLIMGCS